MRALATLSAALLLGFVVSAQDLEEWQRRLKDPDAKVRRTSADALGKQKAETAVPALANALKDPDVDVRIYAALALGRIGPAAKQALPALFEAAQDTSNVGTVIRKSLPSSVTEAAIEAALMVDPNCGPSLAQSALPALMKALSSKDSAILQAVGYSLSKLGSHAKPALPAIRQALPQAKGFAEGALRRALTEIDGAAGSADLIKNPLTPLEQRLVAIADLGFNRKKADAATVDLLTGLLKDPEIQIRAAAVESLGMLGPQAKGALPTLLGLLGDSNLEAAYARLGFGRGDLVPEAITRLEVDAVPPVIALLKDEAKPPFTRYQAARTLSKLGRRAKPALPELEARLQDKLAAVAVESACGYVLAGGDVEKAIPLLHAGLKHAALPVVLMTVDAVSRIGPSAHKVVPGLTALLKHEHPEVRIASAHALSRMDSHARAAVPAMAAMLKSSNDRERYQTAVALERMGSDAREALPILIERLKNLNQVSPNPILTTIGNLGPEAKTAVPPLLELLKKGDEFVAKDVAETLGRIGSDSKAAVPLLSTWLAKPSEYTRIAAARALGQIGREAKEALPALKKLQKDDNADVRVWTAFALARISGDSKPQVAYLIELWKTGETAPRFSLSQAFELLGSDAAPARDLLLEAFLDERTPAGTRRQVARALGHLTQETDAIVPKVIQLIERPADSYERVSNRTLAAEVLGLLGPKAKAAGPALRKLYEEGENEVVEAAGRALVKIEGK